MATITAKAVQALRQKTGIGMMECKKALVEADGNEEEAIKILREKGLAVAAKKSSRIAADGLVDILSCPEKNITAMIEVNTETDFAAKNEVFGKFVRDLLEIIVDKRPANMEELLALDFGNGFTVDGAIKDKVFTIGENIGIRRFVIVEGDVATYIHGKGQIGVIVKLAKSDISSKPEALEAARNAALQIAAMNPLYLDKDSVPASVIENEKEIISAQISADEANSKKPANIIEKMVSGRINKYFDTNCLLLQEYVKDDSMKVGKYIESVAKELGGELKIDSFVRYEKGEGIEKKEEDFAAEIAKLTNK